MATERHQATVGVGAESPIAVGVAAAITGGHCGCCRVTAVGVAIVVCGVELLVVLSSLWACCY